MPGASSPTEQAEALPYHLLHQASGTSMPSAATSPISEQQASLRHINTRKRPTSISAASPRQALLFQDDCPGLDHFRLCF